MLYKITKLSEPTALVVGAPAPIPTFLRQLAEKEKSEPTALVVGSDFITNG
jgi:hypothetical protein